MDFSLADYQPWTCMRVLIVPAETERAFLSVTASFTWGLFKKRGGESFTFWQSKFRTKNDKKERSDMGSLPHSEFYLKKKRTNRKAYFTKYKLWIANFKLA